MTPDSHLDARHDFLRRWGGADDWMVLQLGSLAEVVGGGTPSTDEARYWTQSGIPWATPTDVTTNNAKYISRTEASITPAGLENSSAQLLPAGTVLLTSRATIGAKAIATTKIATNQGFANLVPVDGDSEFLYYLLDLLIPALKRLAAGTTFDEISKRDVRQIWCSVPELPSERRAIVSLLSAADYVGATLIAAHRACIELKRALVQRLLGEGCRGERLKQTVIGDIPESWDVVSIAEIVTEFQYGLSVAMETQGLLPILRMGNIQAGDVVLDDLKYVSLDNAETANYIVARGDVLFNRTNSQELVGKVGIYRHDLPAVFASYLIRLQPSTDVDPYFLGQLLGSYAVQCRIKRYATPGVQQVNVNATNLGKVLVPIPHGEAGRTEQVQIARILEEADAQIRSIQRLQSAVTAIRTSLSRELLSGKTRVTSAPQETPA